MKKHASNFKALEDARVLIIKPSSLGDVLHAFPAVWMLADNLKNPQIDWMVHPAFKELLEYHPAVNRTIIFQRKELGSFKKFTPAFTKLLKEIRRTKYDLVIDLQGLIRSAFFAKTARCRHIAGFDAPKEKISKLFYSHKFTVPPEYKHAIERNCSLVSQLLDIPMAPQVRTLPVIGKFAGSAKKLLDKAGIKPDRQCIGIVPGARWESKCWPPGFYAEVINKTAKANPETSFIILGSPQFEEAGKKVNSLTSNAQVANLTGKTGIGELVELVRRCGGIVCNDSGPMHIAAMLKIPVFAMIGPTNPERTGPYGPEHHVFLPDLGCIKCLKRYCPKETIECHSRISPDEVVNKITSTLGKSK